MSDAISRIVAELRDQAEAAVVRTAQRRIARSRQWMDMMESYAAAANVSHGADRVRAEALSLMAQHRWHAWRALAFNNAALAAHHRKQSHKARAMCAEVRQGAWKR